MTLEEALKIDSTLAGVLSAPTEDEARRRVIAGFVKAIPLIEWPLRRLR